MEGAFIQNQLMVTKILQRIIEIQCLGLVFVKQLVLLLASLFDISNAFLIDLKEVPK